VVADLVRNLAERGGAVSAELLSGSGDDLSSTVRWPESAAPVDPVAPGERTVVTPVLDGRVRRGVLALTLPGGLPSDASHHELLRETAACVAIAMREERLRSQVGVAAADVERLDADLRGVREQLALVRDAERRRLVAAIVTASSAQLAGVRESVRELPGPARPGDSVPDAAEHATAALGQLRDRLGDLIDGFRAVVRGVHPTVLRDHGPLPALRELAVDLPRQVRFTGDFTRRAGWEVESGFYHGVAAVLQVFAASGAGPPLQVTLGYDNAVLTALVRDQPVPRTWIARVREALALDAERVAALGGTMLPEVTGDAVTVRISLPDRFGPAAPVVDRRDTSRGSATDRVGSLLARMRVLAVAGARADEERAEEWSALASRVDEPPRVAVTGEETAAVLDALVGAEVRGAVPDRVTTWLTAGPVPLVTTWPRGAGRPDRAPLAMARLPATAAELAQVYRVSVQWPSTFLRDLTLVDLLDPTPADLAAAADAVVHVLPARPTERDAALLRELRGAVLVIAAASSDEGVELATGNCDVVVRLDPRLALLGATLRDTEFRVVRRLTDIELEADVGATRPARGAEVLRRFPPAALTVARDAIRDGQVDNVPGLARLLSERSGLDRLAATLTEHVAADGDLVVARRVVRGMTALCRRGVPEALSREVERLALTSRELAEFAVLDALRRGSLVLPDSADAIRLLGGSGRGPRERLGLPADASSADIAAAAAAAGRLWQRHADGRQAGAREHDACLVLAVAATEIAAGSR